MSRTYKDAFPNIRHGIFSYLHFPPWNQDYDPENETLPPNYRADKETLDRMMYLDYGDRLQGPILQAYDTGEGVSGFDAGYIAIMIETQFSVSWNHLWNAVTAEYNPVDNYNAVETETTSVEGEENQTGSVIHDTSGAITHGHSITTTNNLTDNQTRTRNLHDATTDSASGTETGTGGNSEKYYGFSSVTGKDSRNQETSGTRSTESENEITVDYTGTETESVTHGGTVSEAHGGTDRNTLSETNATSDSREHNATTSRTLSRHGNIGVTTSAQMIQGEIEVWKWSYYRRILEDVAGYLTLGIFG